ncbi:MAG: sodium:solute symporter family protein [Clostridiales Family XIII bacterium]|jgi:SSS family solute:Na+ symporter|nr:sodium:solute symporter family protein [Clostridiales Family XIII bacterium]
MGIQFRKLATTSEDFMLGGRRAPFWLMLAAYLGGAIGGSSVSGYIGYGYSGGMATIWSALLPGLGLTAFIVIFARRLNHFGRVTGAATITDFLCARYGESVRIPSAIMSFFRPAFITGMQYLAIAIVLRVAFGWPLWVGVLLSAVVILAYLVTAGQYSALVTQWIQAILQSLCIVVFALAAIKLAGGMDETLYGLYNILPANFVNGLSLSWSQFSVWFLTLCLFYLVDPWAYMWAYIGKTPRITQNAQLAMCSQFYGMLVFIAGMCVTVAVTAGNLVFPEGLTPDAVYAYIALNESSTFVGMLLVVGLLMTIISCGSSFIMNGVTILTKDIYKSAINKNANDKQMLNASRISVVIVSLLGIAGALWLPILVPLWVLAQALVLGGLLAAVISAWWWKRGTSQGAFASIVLGGLSAISWAMYAWVTTGSPGSLIGGLHAAHIGVIVSVPVMIIVSLLTKPDYSKANATSYKVLGDAMKQAQAVAGDPDKPGLFGFFGAEKGYIKAAWVLVIILFALHYFLVFGFHMEAFGAFTIWVSIIVSIGMMIIIAIMGAYDLSGFLKKTPKQEERLQA